MKELPEIKKPIPTPNRDLSKSNKQTKAFANVESRLKQTEELLEEMYNMYIKNTEEGRVTASVMDQIDLDERVRFVIYGY